jgi:hypothetical protein
MTKRRVIELTEMLLSKLPTVTNEHPVARANHVASEIFPVGNKVASCTAATARNYRSVTSCKMLRESMLGTPEALPMAIEPLTASERPSLLLP